MNDAFEMMVATKREAEARIRAEFQERWGRFWKCTGCGARIASPAVSGQKMYCCGQVRMFRYTAPVA